MTNRARTKWLTILNEFKDCLTTTQKLYLFMKIKGNYTVAEIATTHGSNRQAVSQAIIRGKKRLKHAYGAWKLRSLK